MDPLTVKRLMLFFSYYYRMKSSTKNVSGAPNVERNNSFEGRVSVSEDYFFY
jgi:hypothetical protein